MGPGRAASPWEKRLLGRGGGRRRKKIHPNKINHDSSGKGGGAGASEGAAQGLGKEGMKLTRLRFALFGGPFSVSVLPVRDKVTKITSSGLVAAIKWCKSGVCDFQASKELLGRCSRS